MKKKEIANKLIEDIESKSTRKPTSKNLKEAWFKNLMKCSKKELELKLEYQK